MIIYQCDVTVGPVSLKDVRMIVKKNVHIFVGNQDIIEKSMLHIRSFTFFLLYSCSIPYIHIWNKKRQNLNNLQKVKM